MTIDGMGAKVAFMFFKVQVSFLLFVGDYIEYFMATLRSPAKS